MHLTVFFGEGRIAIDGVFYESLKTDDLYGTRHVLQWDDARKEGWIEWNSAPNTKLDAGDPSDAALIAFHHDLWVKADKAAKAAQRKKEREAEAERQEEARLAEEMRPLNEAYATLFASDHEVIKAAEDLLAGQGLLSDELVEKRRSAREFVKTNRPKP